ncbi:MAG: hypothetical protein Q9190_005352 [Brigantiaea leucoxantha]
MAPNSILGQDLGSVSQNLAAASTTVLYADVLSDASACQRDIPYLQALQTNVIRTYGLDPSSNHSDCMKLLAEAGIYALVDLSSPGFTIATANAQWNDALYNRYASVIDSMHGYSNVLGFLVGEDVFSQNAGDDSRPYVKAAVRDMKAYIRQKQYRNVGIGYASSFAWGFEDLACGSSNESVDFLAANMRNWCGIGNDIDNSGWANLTDDLSDYPVPVIMADYGCSDPGQRYFNDTDALYSDRMTPVWSGGIVYEYFVNDADYGTFRY